MRKINRCCNLSERARFPETVMYSRYFIVEAFAILVLFGIYLNRPLFASEAPVQGAPPISDHQVGRAIHNSIVEDSSLPYCAHIINVRANNGVVTLKGQVHTREQLENVKGKAADLVGEENVVTDIRVKN